jgi:outer membrane protein TolC
MSMKGIIIYRRAGWLVALAGWAIITASFAGAEDAGLTRYRVAGMLQRAVERADALRLQGDANVAAVIASQLVAEGLPEAAVRTAMQAPGGTPTTPGGTLVLRDVPAEDAAALAVAFVSREGLMQGFPDGTFRGDNVMTDGQVALVLSRLFARLAAGPAPSTSAADSLAQLIATGLAANPELAAIAHRVQAARLAIPQAAARPDPELMLALMDMPVGTFSLDRDMMSSVRIGARQMVPGAGKRSLRRLAAEQEAAATQWVYDEARNELVRDVTDAYYQLSYLDRATRVTKANKALSEAFAKLAAVRYSVGRGPQAEVAQAQVEVSRYLDRLLALDQERATAQARLNTLLDRDPATPVTTAPAPPPSVTDLDEQALQKTALATRPMLKEMESQIARMDTMVELDRRELKPDFVYGFDYAVRANTGDPMAPGRDLWSFSVGVTLPMLNPKPHRAAIAASEARSREMREQYRQVRAKALEEIHVALAMLQRSRRQMDLYREGIIPQAEIAVSSARAGYETGAVDVLALITAQQTLFDYQLDYYMAVTDRGRAAAELAFAVGAPSPGTENGR